MVAGAMLRAMARILIVEDELAIADTLLFALGSEGFRGTARGAGR